jgi:divalent metal cation (Fe/Co/Zn/Cd) transporter
MLGISYFDLQAPLFMSLFLVIILWDLMWKGIGLWKAARNEDKYWFIAILIINSLGIVPILYIYVFQKGKKGI